MRYQEMGNAENVSSRSSYLIPDTSYWSEAT
jgi:hypothetical protein